MGKTKRCNGAAKQQKRRRISADSKREEIERNTAKVVFDTLVAISSESDRAPRGLIESICKGNERKHPGIEINTELAVPIRNNLNLTSGTAGDIIAGMLKGNKDHVKHQQKLLNDDYDDRTKVTEKLRENTKKDSVEPEYTLLMLSILHPQNSMRSTMKGKPRSKKLPRKNLIRSLSNSAICIPKHLRLSIDCVRRTVTC